MDSITMNERKHIVVVAAIIVRDGRIFATQRGYGSGRIGGSSREEKKGLPYFYSHFSVVMDFSFTPNSISFFFIK